MIIKFYYLLRNTNYLKETKRKDIDNNNTEDTKKKTNMIKGKAVACEIKELYK